MSDMSQEKSPETSAEHMYNDSDNNPEIAIAALTPLMRQYREIKNRFPDTLLFFRSAIFTNCFLPMHNKHPLSWVSH